MVSSQLSHIMMFSQGGQGKMTSWPVQSAAMPAQPGRLSTIYLLFVFLRSAHVEPSNRLSDPLAAS